MAQRPHLPLTTALSVWMSNVHRSSTSLLATLVTTSTTFCSAPPSSHSGSQAGRHRGVNVGVCLITVAVHIVEWASLHPATKAFLRGGNSTEGNTPHPPAAPAMLSLPPLGSLENCCSTACR